jgi:Uma2 family endonuclease
VLQTKAPLITRADYEKMPEGPPYFQVIEGDLIMSPSPKTFHQYITGNIHTMLASYLKRRPIGIVILAPLDVFLTDVNIYQPDVMMILKQRASIITDHGLEGAPNLAVEILSSSTGRFDKGAKRKVYSRTGVEELWLIDPEAKTIQFFDFAKDAENPAATYDIKSVFNSRLLPGLRISAKKIFWKPV